MTSLNYDDIGDIVEIVTSERNIIHEVSAPLRITKLDRRQFLKLTGAVGGGLMLSFSAPTAVAGAPARAFQPNGYVKIVSLLISSGAEVSLKDNFGYDAAYRANKNHHFEIVEILTNS